MTADDLPTELDDRLLRGLDQMDAGLWYEAHEELEEVWAGEVGATRHLLQALIQVTVALHHRERGNLGGALALLERAADHLAEVPDPPRLFVDPRELERSVGRLREEFRSASRDAPPRLDPSLAPRFDAARDAIRELRRRRGLPDVAPPSGV
jgi:hypothetical protein